MLVQYTSEHIMADFLGSSVGRAFASHMGDRDLINGCDRYKLLKQVVTVTQPNARQHEMTIIKDWPVLQ